MNRINISPLMLEWACERAGYDTTDLDSRFPRLPAWIRGESAPTLKQVEAFAKATHTPIGYLFLQAPPIETVPIPDFRTIGNIHAGHPSPDLLDTLYVCQQRQAWFRDYARSMGEERRSFVGSMTVQADVVDAADAIRDTLGFDVDARRHMATWAEALRHFIEQAEECGIMVMCNGVVHNNNHRRLDPEEFRGFAMVDDLAPLVFINGADTKAAQMFTLAHELVHIWLGQTALSDAGAGAVPRQAVERWCNRVAAELLVPLRTMRQEYDQSAELECEITRLARRFKVSTLVVLRRMHDAGGLTDAEFSAAFQAELARLRAVAKGSGGNFYLTQAARVSKRFASALVANTLEGQTLFTDAFRLLGFSKHATFMELGRSLGVGA